jgi:murein DD-endopeptidase MepM/ murein hydrolase activator NlpD
VHVVRAGENLYRISLHYGVPVDRLIRANRIEDVHALEVGQALRVPGARRAPPTDALVPLAAHTEPPESREIALRDTGLLFAWPLRGPVSSHFGARGWGQHQGIDIPAREGTPIVAAEAGRVILSGAWSGDYGNVVIVKHAGRYATVYAHTLRNLVRRGEFVEKGQAIAQVGDSGNASGPHLHFEIRRDRLPQDPLLYLP